METPLRYKKTSGFATTSGQLFEVNLAALLFLRGINSGYDFQLGTNVQGAGALDDVVFRFKTPEEPDNWSTLYVQLKHKENSWVNRTMLTTPKGNFSLQNYFKSYLDIKKTMMSDDRGTFLDGSLEKCMFVIFTNAKSDISLKNESSTNLSRAEEFISSDSGARFSFEDEKDILQCLGDCGNVGEEFLGRLRVFCNQPNVNVLKSVVRNELRNLSPEMIRGINIERLCDIFLDNAKVWWERSNDVLHKGHDLLQRALGQARLEMSSQKTLMDYNMLDLAVEESALLPLRDSLGRGFLVAIEPSESSYRLSLTKLVQSIGDYVLVLNCEGLLANRRALLSQWRKGEVKNLIILAKDWNPMFTSEYLEIVKDMLATTQIVLLSGDADVDLTKELPLKVKSVKDTFLFSQLREVSRLNILGKEVNFHGHKIVLSQLIDDSRDSADSVLDASSVVEVLECVGSLSLGSALEESIDYYVERSLERATVVKPSIFQENTLLESVTVRVTQTDTSFDIRNVKRDNKRTGFSIAPGINMKTGLVGQVIQYLTSLNDNSVFQNYFHTEEVAKNIFQSVLVPDENDSEISIGQMFPLGSYECNLVALRVGQDDAVTALRIRGNNNAAKKAFFLFVPDKANENDINKLSNFHQSRHLLSLKDGSLGWIESTGDIELIRRHIDKDQVSRFAPNNVTDIDERLVLVCGEPGMGKSTLVARLARNTKEAFPYFFVLPVALSDHSQLFAKNEFKDAFGFLIKSAKIDTHLHQSLLKHALEVTGNVVVFLDGYDEVAPKYIKQSYDLLSSLLTTKTNNIWMTSRNSMKIKLETLTSKFASMLRKFNEEDQISFLKKFWAGKTTLEAAELDTFISQLLGNLSQTVREKESNFMGVPLQTQMLAEVYEGHVTGLNEKPKLPENLDLLVLLDKFVEKKCHVYVKAKLQIPPNNPNYEHHCASLIKSFIKSHARAALFYLLGKEYLECLGLGSIVKESLELFKEIKDGKNNTGFIGAIVDDEPRFVHRVFAEYFAAYWIAKHYENNTQLITEKIFATDFAVVRQIFDRILARSNALHVAVLTDDLEEVCSLLEGEVDNKIIETKDLGGRTALHLAASRGTSDDREVNLRRGEILDLLIGKTRDFDQVDKVLGFLPIQYADRTQSWAAIDKLLKHNENNCQHALTSTNVTNHDMLESIFDLDLSILMGFCLDNGLAVEHCSKGSKSLLLRACEIGSFHVASLLLKRNAYIVNLNIVNESVDCTEDDDEDEVSMIDLGAMLDKQFSNMYKDDDDLPAHVASAHGHLGIVKLLHHYFISTLGNEPTQEGSRGATIANYMDVRGKNGWTTIHVAARYGHSDVIRFLLSQGANPLSLNNGDGTPLHLAAMYNQPDSFRILYQTLLKVDRAAAVQLRDDEEASLLSCVVAGGSVKCFEILLQLGGYWPQGYNTEITPLVAATMRGNLEVVRTLLFMYNANREGKSKADYINIILDDDVPSAMYYAACLDKSDIISFLISQGGDPCCRDSNDVTPLHFAAYFKRPDTLRVLLAALDEADRAAALNLWTDEGFSVLMCAVEGGCIECIDILIKAGAKLSQASDDGNTTLMLAAKHGTQCLVKHLINNFSEKREHMSKLDFINMETEEGLTALRAAALEGKSEIISLLLREGADTLINADTITPLYLAVAGNHVDTARILLESVGDQAAAVNLRDDEGDSVLMFAIREGGVECIELLAQAGAKLSEVDDVGKTPLMMAAELGKLLAVECLLVNLNTEKEGIEKIDFINMRDKDGCTAIHYAAREGHSDVIGFLCRQGGDLEISDLYNSTPINLAIKNKHPGAVRFLLKNLDEADRTAALNSNYSNGESVLIFSVREGSVEHDCVELLVQAGAKLSQVSATGRTPLMIAAELGHQWAVESLLLNFNAEKESLGKVDYINKMDKDRCTAIHCGAWKGHSDVVRFLACKGGEVLTPDCDGSTPLHLAVLFKHPATVRVLIEALDGADLAGAVNCCDLNGDSVLTYATTGGCLECIQLLIIVGGRLSQANLAGKTPLMASAEAGNNDVVRQLLTLYKEKVEGTTLVEYINMKDNNGYTAIHKAAWKGHSDVVNVLINHGGDPQNRTHHNSTPLLLAAEYKHPRVVKVLLDALDETDRATAVHSFDYDGDTALLLAASVGCSESVELLLQAGGKLTQVNNNQMTPLMAAAANNHLPVVIDMLCSFNEQIEGMTKVAYMTMMNKDGQTALNLAGAECRDTLETFLTDLLH